MGKKVVVIIFILLFILLLSFLSFLEINKKTTGYTIKFDSAGGNVISELIVDKNGKLKEPDVPIREGYIFKGWYSNGKKV